MDQERLEEQFVKAHPGLPPSTAREMLRSIQKRWAAIDQRLAEHPEESPGYQFDQTFLNEDGTRETTASPAPPKQRPDH